MIHKSFEMLENNTFEIPHYYHMFVNVQNTCWCLGMHLFLMYLIVNCICYASRSVFCNTFTCFILLFCVLDDLYVF